MPKKVLLVNTMWSRGGAASVARDLFHHLNSSGMDAYFAYGRGEMSSEDKTFKFGNFIETFIHIFLVRFLGLEGYGNYFSTRKLIRYIKKEKFDLIHLHNLHGYYLNFYDLIKFLNKSGVPVIWTLHDEWPLTWLPAHSMGCTHCKTGEGRCRNSYSYPKTYNKLFMKFQLKKKQKAIKELHNLIIISPAEWLVSELRNSYLENRGIKIISNGVDTELFKPVSDKSQLRQKHDLPANKKIIVFSAGDLNDKNKGVEYAIKTADLLKDKNYLFVGVGKGQLPKRVNIKVLNYITDRQILSEIFASADLFCTTSMVETQPLVVLEAFSSGLPVVGFDILALRELVSEDVGSIVAFGETIMLTKAIESNTTEPLQSKKSENARNVALIKFSNEKFFKGYDDIYKEILK